MHYNHFIFTFEFFIVSLNNPQEVFSQVIDVNDETIKLTQLFWDLKKSIITIDKVFREIAHIINAEGEKIQKAVNIDNVSIDDLISLNNSVSNTLTKVIKLEMILEFKLEEINKLKCFNCNVC